MKKVLVSALSYADSSSGVKDYIVSVCRELLKTCRVELLIQPEAAARFPLTGDNLRFRLSPRLIKAKPLACAWHLFLLPWFLNAGDYDLILLPSGNRYLLSRYPSRTVVTFHDLTQYYTADKYDRYRSLYMREIIPHYLRRAPAIMALSENTKNALIRHYRMEPARIAVNYPGYESERIESTVSAYDLRERFNLSRPYLFYRAAIEHPAKNHLHLIRAFELIPDELREGYNLVFSGPDGQGCGVIYDYAKDSPAALNIKFLGEVEKQWLGELYRQAEVFVFPPLHEDFAIPLLEAMACGVPVICSNRSALPELGGDAVLTFDPEMHADIAVKLIRVLEDPTLRSAMKQKGLVRVRRFSWQRHVEQMFELVQNEK